MALTYVVGAPGSGKSTYAAKLARLHATAIAKAYYKKRIAKRDLKKGRDVYSMTAITGTYKITADDIGKYDMTGGLVLLDEAGLVFNNRDWKSTPKEVIKHAKLHRHYHEEWYIFSQQANDVDNKLENLATRVFLIVPLVVFRGSPILSAIRWVSQKCDIDPIDHKLKVMQYKRPLWIRFIFLPRWWKYFDSYECDELLHKDFEIYGKKDQ